MEDINIEDINIEELFDVVNQPEHSTKVLLDYQNKYGVNTLELFSKDYEVVAHPIKREDYLDWLFHTTSSFS